MKVLLQIRYDLTCTTLRGTSLIFYCQTVRFKYGQDTALTVALEGSCQGEQRRVSIPSSLFQTSRHLRNAFPDAAVLGVDIEVVVKIIKHAPSMIQVHSIGLLAMTMALLTLVTAAFMAYNIRIASLESKQH